MQVGITHDRNFVVVTSDFPREKTSPHKIGWAALFFSIALALVLFSDIRLSLCLFVGAIGMVITGVLSINEAYRAVGWNTVFLLASLIPLGIAVQNTGTASWIALGVTSMLDGWPIWALQAAIAVLAIAFTLVMSNVGATILDLSRNCAAPLKTYRVAKENRHGITTEPGVPR